MIYENVCMINGLPTKRISAISQWKHLSEFYPQNGGESQLAPKLRHWNHMYSYLVAGLMTWNSLPDLSATTRTMQAVSDAYLKRICSRDRPSSALEFFDDSALHSFSKIRIGLPFWYRLTRVVPEKGPLNGCVCARALNQSYSCSDARAHFTPGGSDGVFLKRVVAAGVWRRAANDDVVVDGLVVVVVGGGVVVVVLVVVVDGLVLVDDVVVDEVDA